MLSHCGPGLTSAATGVATAQSDSIPMVVIAGDIPSHMYGRHPHQEINLHADASASSSTSSPPTRSCPRRLRPESGGPGTAVEENVAVIWVIMNNGAYGAIAGLQNAHYGTTVGAIFHKRDGEPYSPDYAALPAGGPVKRAGFVPKKYNGTVQSP